MSNTEKENSQLQAELTELGCRLRTLRLERGWTLGELAQRTQLSEAYLSRLESGDRQPSLAALLALANAYELSLSALFESEKTDTCAVIRSEDTPVQRGNGLLYRSLSSKHPSANLHPIHVTVPFDRQKDCLYQHDGEEWLYVLSGQLKLTLGNQEYVLRLGDAAHFDARTPHQLSAQGNCDAEIVLVSCEASRSLLSSYL